MSASRQPPNSVTDSERSFQGEVKILRVTYMARLIEIRRPLTNNSAHGCEPGDF
jgi:hypothetical protein